MSDIKLKVGYKYKDEKDIVAEILHYDDICTGHYMAVVMTGKWEYAFFKEDGKLVDAVVLKLHRPAFDEEEIGKVHNNIIYEDVGYDDMPYQYKVDGKRELYCGDLVKELKE